MMTAVRIYIVIVNIGIKHAKIQIKTYFQMQRLEILVEVYFVCLDLAILIFEQLRNEVQSKK